MSVTATNPNDKLPPLWFRIGRRRVITDQFKEGNCACADRWHVFYSDDLTDQAAAKKICATCPVLHPCTLWALFGNFDRGGDAYGIIAGLDPDQRERIRSGREHFWDWTKDFNWAEKATRAAARERERRKIRKRDQRRNEIRPCPGCGSNQYVVREGRDRVTNRQHYQCTACGPYFLGEAL